MQRNDDMFKQAQEYGKKRQEEKEALRAKMEKVRREELMQKGIDPDKYKTKWKNIIIPTL